MSNIVTQPVRQQPIPAGDAMLCPNCQISHMDPFYSVEQIPVHSCLLMQSREEALNFPRADLTLGFCPACGFIGNTRYDAGYRSYSARYEETQGYSNCFNSFLENLARKLVDHYELRHKTILEIGCGKGEFLARLCELGDNRGIGVDPGCIPNRILSPAASRIEVIRDYYNDKYAHLPADVVCCRHTLEHIDSTLDFLRMLRRSLGSRTDTLVFFEVPDMLRILKEGAFWDIYYEHCSYFSLGSLGRLFRKAGFNLLDLELDYNDQYILLIAQPISGRSSIELEQ